MHMDLIHSGGGAGSHFVEKTGEKITIITAYRVCLGNLQSIDGTIGNKSDEHLYLPQIRPQTPENKYFEILASSSHKCNVNSIAYYYLQMLMITNIIHPLPNFSKPLILLITLPKIDRHNQPSSPYAVIELTTSSSHLIQQRVRLHPAYSRSIF